MTRNICVLIDLGKMEAKEEQMRMLCKHV